MRSLKVALFTGLFMLFGFFSSKKPVKDDLIKEALSDSISVQLIEANDTLQAENLRRVQETVEEVKVLDSINTRQVEQIDMLKDENKDFRKELKSLQSEISKKKVDTVVVHDTVVIKEKRNFWGRTKTDTLK